MSSVASFSIVLMTLSNIAARGASSESNRSFAFRYFTISGILNGRENEKGKLSKKEKKWLSNGIFYMTIYQRKIC